MEHFKLSWGLLPSFLIMLFSYTAPAYAAGDCPPHVLDRLEQIEKAAQLEKCRLMQVQAWCKDVLTPPPAAPPVLDAYLDHCEWAEDYFKGRIDKLVELYNVVANMFGCCVPPIDLPDDLSQCPVSMQTATPYP